MSLGSITTTTGNVYSVTKVNNTSVIRTDLTNSTGQNFSLLEIGHQPGSTTKPSRHAVILRKSKNDSLGNPVPYAIHAVITMPSKVVTEDDIKDIAEELVAVLTASNVEALVKGSLL